MAHQTSSGKAFVTSFSPEQHHNKPEEYDNAPSDRQPPGVDDEPQSLEEALMS